MQKLNKKDLKFFEDLLNEKKEMLIKEMGYFEENNMKVSSREASGDLSGVAYHLADQATDSFDREQAFQLASREGKYLIFLEEALTKVKEGTFGLCVSCQKIIPRARLEAVPTAKMCIECKLAKEKAKGE